MEGGKKVKKNWSQAYVLLTDMRMFFFKDIKTFNAMVSAFRPPLDTLAGRTRARLPVTPLINYLMRLPRKHNWIANFAEGQLHQRPGGNVPRPSERGDPESGQGLEQPQKRLYH